MRVALFAVVLLACSGGTGTVGSSSTAGPPVDNGHVTSAAGVKVDATISAATIGDECGGSSRDVAAGSCAQGATCTPTCQQSNVQLALDAGSGSAPAKIKIVSVTLNDAADGTQVDELTTSNPQQWTGGGYTAWDQSLAPNTQLKASYSLSAPSWSTIGASTSYQRKFRLIVTLDVDGQQLVLQSAELSREAVVAT